MMQNIHLEAVKKGAVAKKQNKLQVKDEYNKRNRNNEPKVDDTYKRCTTRTKGTRNIGRRQDGKRSENDNGVRSEDNAKI